MYRVIKPFLFLLPPEAAHNLVFGLLRLAPVRSLIGRQVPSKPVILFGLEFQNRVGVAAGLDKNGKYLKALAVMGFGHIEVGTVTPRPQAGNPKPRIFRLPKDRALINRMGFPSDGADVVAKRLKRKPVGVIIGINIGKNRGTPVERAADDYLTCFEKLYEVADYFTINVSSPNTSGLRELQDKVPLTNILNAIQSANRQKPRVKPVLVKVSPDLTDEQIRDVIDVAKATGISGFVATNTTIARDHLTTSSTRVRRAGEGGLSGEPLKEKSLRVVRLLAASGLPVIACGGLSSGEDVQAAVQAGAELVQVYTGLIYAGPDVVKRLSIN